jgi:hypothetical protein
MRRNPAVGQLDDSAISILLAHTRPQPPHPINLGIFCLL